MGSVKSIVDIAAGDTIVSRGKRWEVVHNGPGREGSRVLKAQRQLGPDGPVFDTLILERFPGFEVEVVDP